MNGDGHPDLIEGNHFFNTTSVQLYDGAGHFGVKIDSVGVITPSAVEAADFNGDGKADHVSTSNYYNFGSGVNLQIGNGNGTLQAPRNFATGGTALDEIVGDFNGDGRRDIAVALSNSSVGILLGYGDGTFKAPVGYSTGTAVLDINKADFNGDGVTDLVEPSASGFVVELGNGTFQTALPFSAGTGTNLLAADFDNNGVTDVAIAGAGNIGVSLNDSAPLGNAGNGAVNFVFSAPISTVAGAAVPVTVSAVDASGAVMTDFTGLVRAFSNDPRGTTVSYNFTAADSGTHTFAAGLTLYSAGTESILVSAPLMATASQAITVTPAAATRLALTTPSTTVAGAPMTFTLIALDAWNNTDTNYAGTVHFGETDAQGTVPADYTFTAADAGVHAFTGSLGTVTASGQTITATDIADTTIIGTSAAVTVTPTAAVSLSLVGGGGHIGSAHTVTVLARDIFGNVATSDSGTVHLSVTVLDTYGSVVTGYLGKVHLSSTDSKGGTSDYTFSKSDNGVHVFSYTFKTLGFQTLKLVDTSNASIVGSAAVGLKGLLVQYRARITHLLHSGCCSARAH